MKITSLCHATAWSAIALALVAGCNSDGTISNDVIKGLEGVGGEFGKIGASIAKVGNAGIKANEKFEPIDAYALGRATSAQIVQQYGLYQDPAATRYVNLVGQSLALTLPEATPYSGYHFAILNSNEVNAFASPGAFIWITRGLLRCAETEDELAAVLAHELGHIQKQHALDAIQTARGNKFLAVAATEAVKTAAKDNREQIGQVLDEMADDLLLQFKNGYSRDQESQADNEAVATLKRAGYDPTAMVSLFTKMEKRLKPGAADFSHTHPKTADRIASVRGAIGNVAPLPANPARQARFNAALTAARKE